MRTVAIRPPGGASRRVLMLVAVADWAISAFLVTAGGRPHLGVPLLLIAGTVLVTLNYDVLRQLVRSVRQARASRSDPWLALESAVAVRTSARAARLLLREPRLIWSIVLLIRRRYDGAPAQAFTAYRDALPTWLVLAGVALVELALTAVLPTPDVVSMLLLLLGGWGLTVVLGLTAALIVHPHLIEDGTLRLRVGFWDEVQIPVGRIRTVEVVTRVSSRGFAVANDCASLTPTAVTNLAVRVDPPVVIRGHSISSVQIWVDAPHALKHVLTAT